MEPIDIYTSTGAKFWRHPEQMISFLKRTGRTVISTHISPEGSCNLACSYCSVSKRNRHDRIEIGVIDRYINDLQSRGLKAVIVTGGGEPTIYPEWDLLIRLFKARSNLKFGLITNGIDLKKRGDLSVFDWIRISVNYFSGMETKISLDKDQIHKDCTVGMSMVFDGKNKALRPSDISRMANKVGAQYIRVLPNCLPEELEEAHVEIDRWMHQPGFEDRRFFHQYKKHMTPAMEYCPQSYFRPYLSEVNGGTVFPCDSVVLNDKMSHFNSKYAICKASEILDYMDGKIKGNFIPIKDCTGCVFYENVSMLQHWTMGFHEFQRHINPIDHEDFV